MRCYYDALHVCKRVISHVNVYTAWMNIKMNTTSIKVAKQNAICHTPRLNFIGDEMQQMILCGLHSRRQRFVYIFTSPKLLCVVCALVDYQHRWNYVRNSFSPVQAPLAISGTSSFVASSGTISVAVATLDEIWWSFAEYCSDTLLLKFYANCTNLHQFSPILSFEIEILLGSVRYVGKLNSDTLLIPIVAFSANCDN